jgi:polar amino acid transport system substrate-binding protein
MSAEASGAELGMSGRGMRQLSCAVVVALLAAGVTGAQSVAQSPRQAQVVPVMSADVVKELAPTGRLRAAINLGNGVLAQGTHEAPRGITVDLARELAGRTGLPLDLVPFEAAGKVFEALKTEAWDIAFLAIEPARAAEIEFTPPYVLIEGTYMVRNDSPLREIADVDRPGVRIAVGKGSAYDLYLTRTLTYATVVRAPTRGGRAMIDLFFAEKLDVAAGVRQALAAYAKTDPSVRVMDGRFQSIAQAMGAPRGRPAAARYLRGFIEEMKASGFVAEALRRSGQTEAAVAPAASP